MKNVAIATIWKRYLITNYGSFFQHYALRRFLLERGYDSFRVWDFNEHFGVFAIFRTVVKSLLTILMVCKEEKISVFQAITEIIAVVRRKFLFLRDYRRLIGDERESQNWTENTIYIAGGDQVWTGLEATCWGESVPSGVKKISYAASADWALCEKSHDWCSHAKLALSHFSMISVREEKGRKMLLDVLDGCKTVAQVSDPVFLIDKEAYLSLAPKRKFFSRPTLFCYFVNLHSEYDCNVAVIRRIAEILGCEVKILAVQGADRYMPKADCVAASPTEFLACIRDAKYFITNSYHGLLFSVIFNKQFVGVLQRNRPHSNQNQRQEEFMRLCGLSNRWRNLDDAEVIAGLLREGVVVDVVSCYVDQLVSESKRFLDSALA